MSTSRPERYSPRARLLHWLIAALVAALLATGFLAAAAPPEGKALFLRLHLPLGIVTLLLAVWRVKLAVSEMLAKRRPAPAVEGVQGTVARAVHGLLYAAPIALGVSGVALSALSGAPAAVFGSAPMPEFWAYPPRIAHRVLAFGAVALVALHLAAALFHQFVKRDGLLGRMLPGPNA
jgi:cytochrome b561